FQAQLQRLAEDVRLNTPFTLDDAAAFDEVILASAVFPRQLQLDGIDNDKVINYQQLLSGEYTAGERVAVIGAGGIGVD
ncbi:NADPH-dependent 2,4-dienoyl-CoA reductase, partial [Shewanella sp. A25]|nr:NADPH-dependent 2,4-dienoyl-CoA reductase [Shewanella shenzhenensis]